MEEGSESKSALSTLPKCLSHELIHSRILQITGEGTLMQFAALLKPGLEEDRCSQCAILLIDTYPAVELWMNWTGFNEFENWAYFKAIEILDAKTIQEEYIRSEEQWPLICRAISNNHIDFVKHLIHHCPKLLRQQCDDGSVLQFALLLGRIEIIQQLLDEAEVNQEVKKFINIGKSDFVAACKSSECPLGIVEKFLNIMLDRKEVGWKSSLFRGIQIMAFKRPETLKELFDYFLEHHLDELNIFYEPTEDQEIILHALAHEHLNSIVFKLLEKAPEAAHVMDPKKKMTTLMRAIVLTNMELIEKLVEDYKVDINVKDVIGDNAFTYACLQGNPFIMEYLIKNGITRPVKQHMNCDDEVHLIPCDSEDLMLFAINTLRGSVSIDTFTEVIRCLYETYPLSRWPWIRNEHSREFLFPDAVPKTNQEEFRKRFEQIFKVLNRYRITYKCSNVLDSIMLDPSISMDRKELSIRSGVLQVQMSLMICEPCLEYPCSEMYETKEFVLIKDYVNIENFNEICQGREIASLKRHCRSVIRAQIFSRDFLKKLKGLDDFHDVVDNVFESLQLPRKLIEFLRYEY